MIDQRKTIDRGTRERYDYEKTVTKYKVTNSENSVATPDCKEDSRLQKEKKLSTPWKQRDVPPQIFI